MGCSPITICNELRRGTLSRKSNKRRTPNRVKFFNELGKKCALTVLFEKENSSDRDESWKKHEFLNFLGIFLKNRGLIGIDFCCDVISYLKDNWDCIICQNISTLIGIYEISYLKRKKIPYYIEVDGRFAKDGRGIKEWIKKMTISGAKGYFSTAEETDKYLVTYGADERNIYRYPFSSLREGELLKEPLNQTEKKALRIKLGLPETPIILSIGQFIPRKGFDVLLRSIPKVKKDATYVIIGGNEPQEYVNLIHENKIENVIFLPFMLPEKLSEYFKAADFFVLPTREDIWGLVINEAMAFGLPVVTTDRCIAGLEMVRDKYNGIIVPVDDECALVNAINCLLQNDLYMLGSNSISVAKQYTVEMMADRHIEILKGYK